MYSDRRLVQNKWRSITQKFSQKALTEGTQVAPPLRACAAAPAEPLAGIEPRSTEAPSLEAWVAEPGAFYEEDIAVINEFSKLLKSMRAQMQTRQNTTSAIDRNAFINVLIKHGDKSFNWQTDLGTKERQLRPDAIKAELMKVATSASLGADHKASRWADFVDHFAVLRTRWHSELLFHLLALTLEGKNPLKEIGIALAKEGSPEDLALLPQVPGSYATLEG
ncbi:unnamed protein product [Symbiodinium microadriaticum]|nr:unnamed protein product [Symbiodinium sp. KB8]CAE7463965.1 unnamed protein product [Symbiodinium microadriaticum]